MAEWSKALDSSSSLHLKAWVRIPLDACFDIMAEWLRRLIRNQMGFPRGSSNLSDVVFWLTDTVSFFCQLSAPILFCSSDRVPEVS